MLAGVEPMTPILITLLVTLPIIGFGTWLYLCRRALVLRVCTVRSTFAIVSSLACGIRVAALPFEVGVIAAAFLQPEVGDAFQFLHPFGLRESASEAREQMHVVFHAADEDGRAIELFGDAAEIRVERVARGFVAQERPAVFGGEDQMNVNGGKRLWHSAIDHPGTRHP